MDLFDDSPDEIYPFKLHGKLQFDAQWDNVNQGYWITVLDGEIFYSENFFTKKVSDRCIEYFLENNSFDWSSANWREYDMEALQNVDFRNIKWRHDKLNMYGREVYLPRYSAWYGDAGKDYTYSGLSLTPNEWNKGLLYIKERIDKVAGERFNSVLMNWYRDGEDYLSWHTDDEPELGKNPTIGSVNFGETRRFVLRRNDDTSQKIEFPLSHGSFLLMRGELQHHWQHTVPKQKKVSHSRVNLTFRVIKGG